MKTLRMLIYLFLIYLLIIYSHEAYAHKGKRNDTLKLQSQHLITCDLYITTLLSGYEPGDSNLTITTPDTSLTCTWPVLANNANVPAATEGNHVLKLNFIAENDHKIEISHRWTSFKYNLAGNKKLLIDVYIDTASALPGLMGAWDAAWAPPSEWQASINIPTTVDKWTTISIDLSDRKQVGLNEIQAIVFENMPGTAGTIYIDNLRLYGINPDFIPTVPEDLTVKGHDSRIDLKWTPVNQCEGYNIYRSASKGGPFTKLNASVDSITIYSDFFGKNDRTFYYYVTSLGGKESLPSDTVSTTSRAITDDELLTSVQEATFRYFWDFGHPVSGLARERYAKYDREKVTTGGSGMGLIGICVGVNRKFITRAQATERVLKILTFLDTKASRYHGAWSHWFNGRTGESIPPDNDGHIKGDIVETAFMAQGLLTVRQYFDSTNTIETNIRNLATRLWEEIDWNWYLNGSSHLYWWWSPDPGIGFNGSFAFAGYSECMIAYLLAIASPSHPIPATCYYDGWASQKNYTNDSTYYGYRQWVGKFDMPLFWTHYSFLGFDSRDKKDNYCNYFNNNGSIALIDRAYCIANPKGFEGYSELVWGLTSSYDPQGYFLHAPGSTDNGTITPTAAISSMPFTPDESIATLKHFYHVYGPKGLWGPYGFYDAFNLTKNWFSDDYLAIDQGTIVPMIENYRTGLCWKVFMRNPEIIAMLKIIPLLPDDVKVEMGMVNYTFKLDQNYPNPFNPFTHISYSIPLSGFVTLKIYDILGKEIQILVNQVQKADNYNITINASSLASGIYFYTLKVGIDFVETKKMLLVR